MSYFLCPINWAQITANGIPLNGGLVYTYLAGSSTPAATYTDNSGGTPQQNPIQLNTRGLPPSPIWMLGGQALKFVVKDSLGNLLQTFDGVTGVNDTTAYAASSGSSLIGFIQAGTGAVARTVQSKLRDCFNVKDFGAVGDGTTDDTIAVQACFTAARAAGYGKGVYVPFGRYLVGDLFFSPGTGGVENDAPASLIGDGIRASVFVAKPGTTAVINAKNTSLRLFAYFWVDCNGSAATGFNTEWDVGAGPALNNVYRSVRVSNYTGTGWLAKNNNDCTWDDVQIVNPTGSGQTALDLYGVGGQVSFRSLKVFGAYIDVGAQNINFQSECVTQGIRIWYPSRNLLNIQGGYHYANADNSSIIYLRGAFYECDGIKIDTAHLETLGTGNFLIGGAGGAKNFIDISGTLDLTGGGAGGPKVLDPSVYNGTGALRCQTLVKLSVNTGSIDWAVDAAKFHLVNQESKVGGFDVPDTALSLDNGWTGYTGGGIYEGGWYRRNLPGSRIKIHGMIGGGTQTSGTQVAHLGAAYGPAKYKTLTGGNVGNHIEYAIDSSGQITLAMAAVSGTWLSINEEIELETPS